MRKLLNTLFVTSEDSYLALENDNVVVLRNETKLGQFPLRFYSLGNKYQSRVEHVGAKQAYAPEGTLIL